MELTLLSRAQILPCPRFYQLVKRVLDIVLCLVALPFLLPLMGLCVIAIRLDSPGPALFIQERVGKGGRRFRMYKFRTMQHNLDDSFHRAFMKAFIQGQIGNDENGNEKGFVPADMPGAFVKAFIAPSTDGRGGNGKIYKPFEASQVTRVGHILRKTSLDELPQIINVLRGEMSLVGPRPNVPWEVEAYRPWHYERLEVLPGITGLAQVKGRSSINFDSIVKYDIEYIEKQSVWMDLQILWWTASAVFRGAGAE